MRRVLAALLVLLAPAATAEPVLVAAFDLELIDTSGEPPRPDHPARLHAVSDQIRTALAASGRYQLVDLAPHTARIDGFGHIFGCNGCERRLARELGAAVAATGVVRKVSTLVASIEIVLRDAQTGAIVAGGAADIRGDTEEAWRRGVAWLLEHRILAGGG